MHCGLIASFLLLDSTYLVSFVDSADRAKARLDYVPYNEDSLKVLFSVFIRCWIIAAMGEGGYLQINKSLNADAFDEYLSTQQARLPFLPDVGRISPLVTRVLGFNPGKVSNIGVRFSKVGPSHSVRQLSLLALSALTLSEVHAAGNKHIYSRQRIYKNTD